MFLLEFFQKFSDIFAIFGGLVAAYYSFATILKLLNSLRTFVIASTPDLRKYGEWAVVTGATDGIGKAYVQELARLGISIVLVSRSPDKLADVAKEIESKYNVKTKEVAVDFTLGVESGIYEKIREAIVGLDIGVLVNNVGMSYKYPEFFAEIEDKKLFSDIIHCNTLSMTMVTHLVLPRMAGKKKGVVINVSSASACRATPLLAVYGATKTYVEYLTNVLRVEYGSRGIIFQTVLPFFVATKMSRIRKATFFVPDPISYVRSALCTIGRQDTTFGCVAHALQGYIVGQVPWPLFLAYIKSVMLASRKRALQLKSQKKE